MDGSWIARMVATLRRLWIPKGELTLVAISLFTVKVLTDQGSHMRRHYVHRTDHVEMRLEFDAKSALKYWQTNTRSNFIQTFILKTNITNVLYAPKCTRTSTQWNITSFRIPKASLDTRVPTVIRNSGNRACWDYICNLFQNWRIPHALCVISLLSGDVNGWTMPASNEKAVRSWMGSIS